MNVPEKNIEVLNVRGEDFDIRVNREFLDKLKSHRILLDRDPEVQRWKIGQVVRLAKSVTVEPYTAFRVSNFLCSAGSFSSILSDLGPQTSLGRYCSVALHCTVMGFRHPIEAVSQSSAFFDNGRDFTLTYRKDYAELNGNEFSFRGLIAPQKGNINIGHDVWIGAYSALAPGISIGNGAVIAAHSVVVKDVAPYTIVGGNPAKEIKKRFSDAIIEGLEKTRWWDYQLSDLHKFNYTDPMIFIGEFLSRRDSLTKVEYTPFTAKDLL